MYVRKQKQCSSDQVLLNGHCYDKPKPCKSNQVLINGICYDQTGCTQDQVLLNGHCYDKPKPCKSNQVLINGICYDKPGCTQDQVLINGICYDKTRCPFGTVVTPDGHCAQLPSTRPCAPNQVKLANGVCADKPNGTLGDSADTNPSFTGKQILTVVGLSAAGGTTGYMISDSQDPNRTTKTVIGVALGALAGYFAAKAIVLCYSSFITFRLGLRK